MLSHVCIGTNNFEAALAFYTTLMRRLGFPPKFIEPERPWAGWRRPGHQRPLFILGQPFDGAPATVGNGQMVALLAASHRAVDECHLLALRSGARDEGASGFRPEYHPHYYGSYFRDPDGNKLCLCCHDPAGAYDIRPDDLSGEPTRRLIAFHLAEAHANSPPGGVYALDVSGLLAPGVQFFTLWDGENLTGMAALKALGDNAGEVKSMRTHPDYLRKGVARRLLAHLLAEAVMQGMTRLSLETGSGTAFEPALCLYRAHGFVRGPRFSDYEQSSFNQFLHLDL